MGDFYISAGFTRSEISDALVEDWEQTMWVLADLAGRADALDLVENIHVIDGDAESVAAFFDDLAEAIRADAEADGK